MSSIINEYLKDDINDNNKTDKKDIDIDLEIEIDSDNDNNDNNDIIIEELPKNILYCPSWMFPERFGLVKVSSVIRALVIIILAIIIITFFILTVIPDSPVNTFLEDMLKWIESIPLRYQILAILALYIISAPLGTPITPLNLACGFLFSYLIGFIVAIIGSMSGASTCYLCGRTLLYKWAHEKMEKHKTLKALSIAVQTKAIFIVALTHLSPILPATLLHYTYSAVGVHFTKFSIGTFLGIFPFVIIYVCIGAVAESLAGALASGDDDDDTSLWKELMWMFIIVAFSALILVLVTWIAKRELNKAVLELDHEDDEEEIQDNEDNDSDTEDSDIDIDPSSIKLQVFSKSTKTIYDDLPSPPSNPNITENFSEEMKEQLKKFNDDTSISYSNSTNDKIANNITNINLTTDDITYENFTNDNITNDNITYHDNNDITNDINITINVSKDDDIPENNIQNDNSNFNESSSEWEDISLETVVEPQTEIAKILNTKNIQQKNDNISNINNDIQINNNIEDEIEDDDNDIINNEYNTNNI